MKHLKLINEHIIYLCFSENINKNKKHMKLNPKNIHIKTDTKLDLPELPQFNFIVPIPEKDKQIKVIDNKPKPKSNNLF